MLPRVLLLHISVFSGMIFEDCEIREKVTTVLNLCFATQAAHNANQKQSKFFLNQKLPKLKKMV